MDASAARPGGNEQIMGNHPGQLNLRGTRQRAAELGSLVDELLATLRFAPHTLRWNDVVDKMAVLNVQIQQLQDEIRPVTHHYALHPKSVSAQNAGTLPIMLASMLYPEQQALCDEVVQGVSPADCGRWKETIESVSGDDTRKRARRRGAGLRVSTVAPVTTVAPLDEAEQELLHVASFGGL